jgi:hypothetical protein
MSRRIVLVVLALGALLALPAGAAATHPPDTNHAFNSFSSPEPLPTNDARGPHTNAAASVQASEPLTTPDDNSGCTTAGTIGANGVDMGRTLWYQYVAPASGSVTISAKGSLFDTPPAGGSVEPLDTVMAVYATTGTPTTGNFVRCNDDASTSAPIQYASQVTFTATAGVTYKIQIGAWRGLDDGAGGATQPSDSATAGGDYVVASLNPLVHDRRSNILGLSFGTTPAGQDNLGTGLDTDASNQPTEDTFCDDSDEIPSVVGSTVWYRIVVPAPGDVTITAGPFDTVLQLYRQGQDTPLTCNDDRSESDFSSRIQTRLEAGTYDIQVGGWRGTQSPDLNIRADYTEDLDLDDDGHNRPADCNDGNAAVNPGATDVPGNGVDENCSGADATSPPPPPSPPPAPNDTTAPAMSSYTVAPLAFPAAPSGPSVRSAGRRRVYGTRVSYRLDEPATTTFAVQRRLSGRRVGRRCVAPTPRNRRARRCARYAGRGSFDHAGRQGANGFRFTGRVAGRRLAPGAYRFVTTARDGRGNRSRPLRRAFRVTR